MQKTLAVRMDLIKRYSHAATPQETKQRKERLCFAIWCKMQHSNSVIFPLTKKDIKQKLGVGYDKAKRLLVDVKEDTELFTLLGQGRFIVNSFKDKEKKYDKKGREYRGALVVKVPVKADYTLKDLYLVLNNILYTSVITGAKSNSFNVGYQTMCANTFLTTKKFMKVVGMSCGSVSRIKKKLVAAGKITSTAAEVHMADARIEGQKEQILQKYGRRDFTYKVGTINYLVIPCSYSIKDDRITDSFLHRIYDYDTKKVRGCKTNTAHNAMYQCDPSDNFYQSC